MNLNALKKNRERLLLFLIFLIQGCTSYTNCEWYFPENPVKGRQAESPMELPGDLFVSDKKISVIPIRSGELEVRLSGAINLKHPRCQKLTDKSMRLPVYAYLVHHEEAGFFLIDTGTASSYRDHVYGPMTGLLLPLVMSRTFLGPDRSIKNQLLQYVNSIEEIKTVYFTHLHLDHTSGLPELGGERVLVCGKGEWSPSIPILLKPNHFRRKDVIQTLDFEADYSVQTPYGRMINIFSDGSFWALSTPGHSRGHTSYIINSKPHPVLIAGDASILNLSVELGAGPGSYSASKKKAQISLDNICALKEAYPALSVWSGHDVPY